MNLSILSSLFKKKLDTLHVPDSILVKKLKSLSTHSNLLVYTNIKIYHHKETYHIPLIMLDPLRGLYIFEIKPWSYDDLKDAHIQKAKNQSASTQTLSFDNTHDIIRKKFNELTHQDGVAIFNYLIMENLSSQEYEHLNDSFKALLPQNKLIFNDYKEPDIFKKLQAAAQESSLPSVDTILGTLFIQYAILDKENRLSLATQEQINFIDANLEALSALNGPASSGKSTLLLLKALVTLLENPHAKITLLKPTILACDIAKKRVLELVEYAIVEVDLSAIEIITPLEFLNRNLQKLNKKSVKELTFIDEKLMRKSFKGSTLLLCDDSDLLERGFIEYLKFVQKKDTLVLVNQKNLLHEYALTQSFTQEKLHINFLKTNPYAKTLRLVQKLLQHKPKELDILIICQEQTRHMLREDLKSFIDEPAQLLNSSTHLIKQSFSPLMLATYADINTLSAKHIIMLDLGSTSSVEIEHALFVATESVHVLYEDLSQEIINLKEKYESTQK